MNQIVEFFKKLFDSSDWPPRWHCGRWTEFHGWLYIISDLLIWTAYFTIPVVIIRYISKKQGLRFVRIYFLFAAFILACGATHFLDAIAFWIPAYRLNALVRLITGVISWITVFYLVRMLPTVFSLKTQSELEAEIEQRKKAERQSRESEEQAQTIFNAAPDAVIVINDEGRIIKWNSKSETLFGWKADEVMGALLSEVIIPSRYREAHKAGLERFLKTGEGPVLGKTIEIQALNKNNIEFDVSLSISPTVVNGKYLFIGFVRDITENKRAELAQKKAEEKIKESEEKLSMLFNSMDEGFCIIQMLFDEHKKPVDYRFLVINPSFEKQTGLHDAVGKRMREFAPDHEEHWFETYGKIALTGEPIRFENRAEQLHRWYDVYAFRFGEPKNLQVAIFFKDITERKQTEETIKQLNLDLEKRVEEKTKEVIQNEKRFRALIENSSEVIIVSDLAGNRIFVSEGIKHMLGYTPQEYMKLNIFDMVPPGEAQSVRGMLQQIVDNPGQTFTISVNIQHKNGSWRWIEAAMAGFLDVPGLNGIVITYRDVTERKEAEESLRKSFKEISDYKYALDESSIVAITDQKGIIKYANENFCKISKYTADELIGQDHQIINSGYHSKEFIRNLWVTIANGRIWKGELKNKAKDGTIYWVDTTIVPFLDEEGKPYQYIAIRADITERKQAEQALHESQQLLSAVIDNSTAVIYVKNLQGQYLMVNRRFSELFHLNQENIPGKTDYDFFPKEQADAFRQMDVRVAAASHALTEEEMAPQDDGLHTYISVKSILRDNTGKPYAIFGISTDITERKKAEEAILRAESNYREIFENATDAIYVHEIDTGKVIEVNHRAVEVTGYTKEELLNADPRDFITDHPDYTLEKALGYIQKAASGKQQLFEWLGKKKDGTSNWFEVNLKKANITGQERILAFFREINDRKKAQLEIQKLNEGLEQKVTERTAQLETVNKELEAFSYSVSHDLRAPLRIIDGYTEIIVSDYGSKLDEEGNRLVGVVTSNVRRMGQLIDDLLNLSRQGRKELNFRLINMAELVKSVIAEQDIAKTSQSIIQIGKLEPAYCDSSLIRQVWINLISNAIKYSGGKDNPGIEIDSVKSGNEIIYSIKDNGVGFDMQYADKLFGVFQRLHKTTEFEGTGVGLALVHRIITRHGGRVWAEAAVDKGATFYFSLPVNSNKYQNN